MKTKKKNKKHNLYSTKSGCIHMSQELVICSICYNIQKQQLKKVREKSKRQNRKYKKILSRKKHFTPSTEYKTKVPSCSMFMIQKILYNKTPCSKKKKKKKINSKMRLNINYVCSPTAHVLKFHKKWKFLDLFCFSIAKPKNFKIP